MRGDVDDEVVGLAVHGEVRVLVVDDAMDPADPPDAVLARLDDVPAVAWKAPIIDVLRPFYGAVARPR